MICTKCGKNSDSRPTILSLDTLNCEVCNDGCKKCEYLKYLDNGEIVYYKGYIQETDRPVIILFNIIFFLGIHQTLSLMLALQWSTILQWTGMCTLRDSKLRQMFLWMDPKRHYIIYIRAWFLATVWCLRRAASDVSNLW